jgi:glucose/arabinose dehydrogenase
MATGRWLPAADLGRSVRTRPSRAAIVVTQGFAGRRTPDSCAVIPLTAASARNGARARRPHAGRSTARGLLRVLLVALVAGAGAVAATPAAAGPALPAGFVLQDMPSGQSELLTGVAFAPDGSYFTAGKNGRVAWVSATGEARTLAELDVDNTGDLGLTSLAVAGDYESSGVVYTARAASVGGQTTMRVSAWTAAGAPSPTSLTDERVIWDLPATAIVHATTGLVAAPDGTLWVSIGDSSDFTVVDPQALRALDTTVGYGKVLHVLPDGRGVPGNPFYDPANPSSWQSRIYASGFRSPFRFSLDPTTGAPVVGDVGWNAWEEVDLVRPGASYGWPCWEGRTPTPGYADLAACQGVGNVEPLWTYQHGPQGTCVTGGVIYTGASYPEEYRGAYFFGDYSSQRLYTLRHDDQGQLTRAPEDAGFGVDIGGPVDFGTAANGDIVYADIGGSTLKRLVYVPGNRPPSAEATTTTDPVTRTVTFDGSGSGDLDGDPITLEWDFGDGSGASGVRVSHVYAAPGTAPVTALLTVTDAQGARSSTSFPVVPANGVPVVTLTGPPPGRQFAVGDRVRARATATDREDGRLPVTWSAVLVHCSGGYCHQHPGESFTGARFNRPFEDHGDQTRWEITATATDRFGVQGRQSFIAEPRLRTLTVAASTPSAITVNGVARASTEVTVGARVSVIAPTVASDGVATFERWDDGAARARELRMPDRDLALFAVYVTPPARPATADGSAARGGR